MKKHLNIIRSIIFLICLFYSFNELHQYFLPHNISAHIYKLQNKVYSDSQSVNNDYAIKIKSIYNLNYTEDDKNYYLIEHDNGVIPIEVSKNKDILKAMIDNSVNFKLSDNYIVVRVYPMYLTGYYGNEQKISNDLRRKIMNFIIDNPNEYFSYVKKNNYITENKLLVVSDIRNISLSRDILALLSLIILTIISYFRFKKLFKNNSLSLQERK